MGIKIIAYSYQNKVNAIEINEADIEKFVEENEAELDKDVNGETAYSIYGTRTGAELAKVLFTNTYMTEYEPEDEDTDEDETEE
jgi:hypothetical protein